jgi:hypothetical protein
MKPIFQEVEKLTIIFKKHTMNTREFTELLKGCRPVKDRDGNIIVQSILNMQIVCLTTDAEYSLDSRFGNPLTALRAGNSSYGQINFTNTENKEIIVPTQMAVMTKQRAQNHGMSKAGYIGKKGSVTYNDAGCVQGSQTGHFSETNEFRMLPVTMREMAFETVGSTQGHSNLYPAIHKLGRDTASNTDSYLNKYFEKYDKKLEQFIAHFERPSNLIGIIVLIDGEIVAIDKFPSFTYAEQVWDMMIRDCYGSLAVISELKNKSNSNIFTQVYEDEKRNRHVDVVDLLEATLKKTKRTITQSVEEKIQELLELIFDASIDTEGNPNTTSRAPKSFILKTEGYVGQVITENEFNHIVSIVKKEAFNPNALRQVNELKRKARRQDRFSL